MPALPKLAWQRVNTETLPAALQKHYADYQKALEVSNAKRKIFEEQATAHLTKAKAIPAGEQPVYGYNWGKFSIAFKEASKSATGSEMFKF